MKSYIIKIELDGSEPLIWRRVIMPAGATFNRLEKRGDGVVAFHESHNAYTKPFIDERLNSIKQ